MTLTNLGEVHHRAGHRRTAVEFYEQGLRIYRDIGDRRREAETWQLGHVRDALGERAGPLLLAWRPGDLQAPGRPDHGSTVPKRLG